MNSTANKRLKSYKEISFFYSPWFTVALTAFVYLFWYFKLDVYGITLMLVLAGVIMATCRDLSPIVIFCFIFTQIINDPVSNLSSYWFYIAGGIVLLGGAAIHIIRFRFFKNYGKIQGFSVAVSLTGLAIAIGGITIPNRSLYPALVCLLYGAVAIGAVFFLTRTLGRDGTERLTKIIIRSIFACSALALIQLLTVLLKFDDPIQAIASKYSLATGWGEANYVANVMARAIPLAIWLSVSNKRFSFIWLFVAYAFGVAILITSSRATLLMAVLVSLVCLVYYFPKLDYKRNWLCSIGMIIGITLIGIGVMGDRVTTLFSTMINNAFSSSGRTKLWKIALERFTRAPIFGVGFDYDLGGRTHLNPHNTPYTPYWYHNTVIQILCCAGIFGILVFGCYFFHQYRVFGKAKGQNVKALMFVLVLIQAISLLDIHFFTPQEYLQMMIITIAGVKALPAGEGNSYLYALSEKIKLKKKKTVR